MNAVDTNVLVYACDKSEPRRQAIAKAVIADTSGGILLWQIACEFIAAERKLERKGFDAQAAWARLDEYLDLYHLVVPEPSILESARDLHLNRQWSFWDAVLVAASMDAGVTKLYSEDLPGQDPPAGLEIINPFA